MNETIVKLSAGLAFFLTILASQAMSQTPIQVKGSGWKASTNFAPALATDGNNAYIAWVDSATSDVYFAAFTGSGWINAQPVSGTKLDGAVWTAESSATPAWGYDGLSFYLFWKGKTGKDIWFSQFSVEDGSSVCYYDSLSLFDGWNETAGGDVVDGCGYPPAVVAGVDGDIDHRRNRRRRQTFAEHPLHDVAVALLDVEQSDRVVGDHDAGAGPEQPRQRGLRSQAILQTEAVSTEFEGDPAEHLIGFQQ